MVRPTSSPPAPRDWIVVANASRARVFERDAPTGAMRELIDLVHPASRQKGSALGSDRPGQAAKGQASTAFPPRTEPHERESARFAAEVAQQLDEAVLAHRCPGLVLMASSGFLGDLRLHLGDAARHALKAAIALDLTAYSGTELEHRVAGALLAHH